MTRKIDEQGETVTSSNPIANAVPGPPGQVREKGVCWCCSRHGQPSGGGSAAAVVTVPRCAARRSSAGSRGSAPRFAAKRGGRRLWGEAGWGGTARGTPGLPEGPGAVRAGARLCSGNWCFERGRVAGSAGSGTGSAPTAPSQQGPSGAGRG